MAIKDFDTSENKERQSKEAEDRESHHTTADRYPEAAKGIGETDVKNAHATGDGSYGRNDESLPDGEEEEKKGDNIY